MITEVLIMIRLIMEKELREIIGSTKFAVTFGVCAVLILLAFYAGIRNYQVGVEQYESGRRESVRKLEGITDWKDVRSNRISLKPQPIASLVMGVSNDIGRNVEVGGRGELSPEDSRYSEDPIFAVFRFLDLDFIFQIVLSLFAILFAYDAINGEKERGTLRLSFSNAVPRASYMIGKIAGSFLALGVPLLIPILLGALLMTVMGVPMKGSDWTRLALIAAAGLLYFGVFLTLAVFISSVTQRSSTSFLLSLVVWILSVMVLPRTAVLIAGRAVDVPSVDELASAKSRYSASLWQEDRKKMAEYHPEAGGDPDKMMQEFQRFMSSIASEREKKLNVFASRLNEERRNKQDIQERLAFTIARISPSAVFSLASSAIAGTGVGFKDEYKRAAEEYQQSFAEFIKGKTGMNPSGGIVFRVSSDGPQEKKDPINPHELPEFVYRQQPLSAAMGAVSIDFGILALFAFTFFACAFRAFLRYDVR
jgi:ABC-type transport system involved in multi-copper enzyme maturation permease subunit